MDHYIAEFNKVAGNCKVKDYAVYLEKKRGFERLNPFAVQEQMVLFLTDRGTSCVRVRGMGELCQPESPERAGLTFEGKLLFCESTGKQYRFVRKWKDGCTDSYQAFVLALQNGK